MDTVCLNGEFVGSDAACISISDGGFLLGDGVFETMRCERGQVLGWNDHYGRLARGARTLEIPFNHAFGELLSWCHQVLDSNGMAEARMRMTLTRGPIRNHPAQSQEGEPTLLITATELDKKGEEARQRGWSLMLAPFPRNHRSPVSAIKGTSYVESLLARRGAARKGFDDALLLNTEGAVAEGAISCVFAFLAAPVGAEPVLATPRIEDGALAGTMRARILRLARQEGLATEERRLVLEDFLSAEEVFATNAVQEIAPVVRLGERLIGSGTPGRRTLSLYEAHRREVARYLLQNEG